MGFTEPNGSNLFQFQSLHSELSPTDPWAYPYPHTRRYYTLANESFNLTAKLLASNFLHNAFPTTPQSDACFLVA
ncbi:hypothetical protein PISMIDRAFT_534907 [Pisolithus microcarpus 441]|uniref:Uncharacterized protein n=1 Tax=Pisolithus microcarpus 441 TaxID=765257 RepID=A0A0C9Y1L0_9AGAM|nr:hypothetical protein PISMIDRAFT_534907 [Pisolithus microcarpus 441]